MKRAVWTITLLALCWPAAAQTSLLEARRGHKTRLLKKTSDTDPLTRPPPKLFSLIKYRGPTGMLAAYVGKPPAGAKKETKHPAMIWITGGFPPGGIGANAWEPVRRSNDQSAKAYRLAGLVMMYPTFRGSFGNPGVQEGLYGEVDDVIVAAAHLARLDYVDPKRIYLGGHSTGGTLALLLAASTIRFRAVIAFGPVSDTAGYGQKSLPFDVTDAKEARLRAPIHFLPAIRTPTFVIEGTGGNVGSLRELKKKSTNPKVQFFPIRGASHFDLLAPLNALVARKIAGLRADAPLRLDMRELQAAYDEENSAAREASDLQTLARARRAGVRLETRRTTHYFFSRDRETLKKVEAKLDGRGFKGKPIEVRRDKQGAKYYVLLATRRVTLSDLEAVFAASKAASGLATAHGVQYGNWEVE